MRAILLLLALGITSCVARVDFTHSELYEIEDFKRKDEIPIPKCDNGCLIFASTMGDGFEDSPSGYDPYAENLIIFDRMMDRNLSITDLSRKYDKNTSQKTPMVVSGPASISVLNFNEGFSTTWPIVLYVVEYNKAVSYSYEIYDALNMKGVTVSQGTTTILSAYPISLTAKESASPNSVTARLVGFDNVLDQSGDECPIAYSTPLQPFNGFTLNVDGPIISLYFSESTGVEITVGLEFPPAFDLSIDGIITSGGWNGCKKPQSGGVQSFHSFFYEISYMYTLESNTDKYNATLDFVPNLDKNNKVSVHDVKHAENNEDITGYDEVTLIFEDTDLLRVLFNSMSGDQGFLLRYSAVGHSKPPNTQPATTKPTSTSSSTTTTQKPTTTTSGVSGITNTLLVALIAGISASRMM